LDGSGFDRRLETIVHGTAVAVSGVRADGCGSDQERRI